MSKLTTQVTINAPKEKVWEVLADFGAVQNFAAGVSRSYYTSDTKEGAGASRHCDLQNPSGYVEERVTEWREGGGYTFEIYESNAPLKTAAIDISLKHDGARTMVTATLEYQLKFGPIGSLVDLLIVRQQFRKGIIGPLAGLKHYVETGELIGEDTKLPESTLAAVSAT